MTQTLFDKLWDRHCIADLPSGESLIAIDRVFLHERTGSVALMGLVENGRAPRYPQHVFCTMDHIVSNDRGRGKDSARTPTGDVFIKATRKAAKATAINLIDVLDPDQGIVHVIAPELGIAQPGLSMVCPDSHTCSLGALGAMAWGIGSTDAEHAMATGTLRLNKPPQMRIRIEGALSGGVSAKDLALHIIAKLGASGAKRCAVEYSGSVITHMPIEGRLTLCNMAVEFSAFSAVIAPDAVTTNFLSARQYVPKGKNWDSAAADWNTLFSDDAAIFDYDVVINGADVGPTVTWGTSPEHGGAISGSIPQIKDMKIDDRAAAKRAMDYMQVREGQALSDLSLGGAFIGSCTNGRLSDLRAAAAVLKGRHVAPGVEAVCVPGSQAVRRAAQAEGLDEIFKASGFSWGAPGCAMCFYAGGATFAPGTRVISSTNRNFESRQGPGVLTHLASPAVVAASAIAGHICAPDDLPNMEAVNVA